MIGGGAVALERKSGIPLYVQVARMVSRLIDDGTWEPGLKLPPERHMSRILGVSRNTASACYRYLQERGLVTSCQGRGTYVAGRPQPATLPAGESGAEALVGAIDLLLELGAEHGLDPGAVSELVAGRASIHCVREPRLTVALVECNHEQLDFFAQNLSLGPGVVVQPVLLGEPVVAAALLEGCRGADLVVTTFFHLEQVEAALGDRFEVLGISLDPDIETMVRIAQLPAGVTCGLVCLSAEFAQKVLNSLEQAGLGGLQVEIQTASSDRELAEFLSSVEAVIVSPGRRLEVTRLAPEQMPVLQFIYYPDNGSVRLLAARLAEIVEGGRSVRTYALESGGC